MAEVQGMKDPTSSCTDWTKGQGWSLPYRGFECGVGRSPHARAAPAPVRAGDPDGGWVGLGRREEPSDLHQPVGPSRERQVVDLRRGELDFSQNPPCALIEASRGQMGPWSAHGAGPGGRPGSCSKGMPSRFLGPPKPRAQALSASMRARFTAMGHSIASCLSASDQRRQKTILMTNLATFFEGRPDRLDLGDGQGEGVAESPLPADKRQGLPRGVPRRES